MIKKLEVWFIDTFREHTIDISILEHIDTYQSDDRRLYMNGRRLIEKLITSQKRCSEDTFKKRFNLLIKSNYIATVKNYSGLIITNDGKDFLQKHYRFQRLGIFFKLISVFKSLPSFILGIWNFLK